MTETVVDALNALSHVCNDVYNCALANLAVLAKKKTFFSNPYKKVQDYPLDAITQALELGQQDDGQFILLASMNNSKADFGMHERLTNLATAMTTCNHFQGSIKQTMKNPGLASAVIVQTQSIAILASLVGKFAAYSAVHLPRFQKRAQGIEPDGPKSDKEIAQQYFNAFGADLKKMGGLVIDRESAGAVAKSANMPIAPAIINYDKQPNGRKFNGIWMTAEMETTFKDHLARQQAAAMSQG